ncbi:unnamed protein product [marine sediment metagenome]|uniref:Uncharacterized protein n=1 Tax=marine sediment metagenome TaxID=412755 RepID=X1G6U6_9ZZZZ
MEIIEIMFRNWPWPIVFLIFIIMFREPIFEFLKRLKTLKIFSAVLETEIPAEQEIKEMPKSKEEIRKSIGGKNAKLKLTLKEYSILLKNINMRSLLIVFMVPS